MVRRSYKPYKSNYRSYAGKKKWAPVMRNVVSTSYTIANETTDGTFFTLVSNSVETSNPTPTIIKAKHLKVSVDFVFDSTVLSNGFCCLIYVPQGITPTAGLPILHPEWMLAWRNIPNDVTAHHHNIMLQSSMCRNLNSGDSIVCYFSFNNLALGPTALNFTGRYSAVVRNN